MVNGEIDASTSAVIALILGASGALLAWGIFAGLFDSGPATIPPIAIATVAPAPEYEAQPPLGMPVEFYMANDGSIQWRLY